MIEEDIRTMLTGNDAAARVATAEFLSPDTYDMFLEVGQRLVPYLVELVVADTELASDDRHTQRMLAVALLRAAGAESEIASIRDALLPRLEHEITELIEDVRNDSNRARAYYLISLLGRIGSPDEAPFLFSLLPLWYWKPTTSSWGYTCNVSRSALQALKEIGDTSIAESLSQLISENKLRIAEGFPDDGRSQTFKLLDEARDVISNIQQKMSSPPGPQ